jgi:hypothetical protein
MSMALSMRTNHAWEMPTLWLQISVDEAHQMEILQRGGHLGSIESRRIFVDTLIRSRL